MAEITLTSANYIERGYLEDGVGYANGVDPRAILPSHAGYIIWDVSAIPAGSTINSITLVREFSDYDPSWLESASELFQFSGYGSGTPFQSLNPRTELASLVGMTSGTNYGGNFFVNDLGELSKNRYGSLNLSAASELQQTLSSGIFTLILQELNDSVNSAWLEFTIHSLTINYTPATQVHLDIPVQASADDRITDSGSPFDVDSNYQNFGQTIVAYWRWPLNIPPKSTIVAATVVFYPASSQALSVNQNWQMNYRVSGNASDYSTGTEWYNDANWAGTDEWDTPSPWTDGDEIGDHDYNCETPDIASYIQTIVNRSDFVQGNYFGLRIRYIGGGANQLAETRSVDYSASAGARLFVDYIPYVEPQTWTSTNTISVNLYQNIAKLYALHLLGMRDVQESYLTSAEEILFADDFDVELDLLRKLYDAFQNTDFYNSPAAAAISAVASLNAHVLKNARDNDGVRFTDINDWLLAANGRQNDVDDAITVPSTFAEMSNQAGYPIDSGNIA